MTTASDTTITSALGTAMIGGLGAPGDAGSRAALLRALDVISEQRRRIEALQLLVTPGRRRILDAAGDLRWRSSSRAEFDARVAELADRLVLASAHLTEALDQSEHARRAALAAYSNGAAASGSPGYSGYPATSGGPGATGAL